ncbi:PIN domain-containing protein [Streptomyces glomeratus]|uniref:PIN domain-containing protein n=1 Tax=Streptomyces glomeratus TaxID=284452 RepID=A0ABP6M6T0_9ACTN|nr:PIN domain-containing protein [Streptomyces glomeratus]MCF1510410.1 PIN domain-containing protein [Streptomyces glomeratus]
MLVTPRPGADRRNIRDALRDAHTTAGSLRCAGPETAFSGLMRYLNWATDTAGFLRHQISDKDIDDLILTRRYHALLGSCGTLAGSAQERLVNGLINLEVDERIQAFEDALEALNRQIERWSGREMFVVADSSFYIQSPDRLEVVDLHQVLGVPPNDDVRLLFPIAVVDELDGLKDAGKHQARWRATHTLGLLDGTLRGEKIGVLRHADRNGEPATWRGEVIVEIVLDQPGHVRLPITDDEIIDRAVAIQALAARDVRLLTCDTGQHTRGRAAGLKVTKVLAKDPGPEPDWEAQDKPGNGTRAKRRERQAAPQAATAK